MTTAERLLALTAVVLLVGGVCTGLVMGRLRETAPDTPKYLRLAHVGAYMQAPLVIGMLVLIRLAAPSDGVATVTALLISAGALSLFAKDLINWRLGVVDEFQPHGVGYALGTVSSLLQVAGLVMVTVVVLAGW
ncbi:MAG: hypothetical protein ACK5OX_07520 [Desertimonas sp.]